MEDKDILGLYWARDEAAIARTAEKYGGYCGSIARNILENAQDVEECLNDAWLGAWSTIPPKRPENLAAYLGKLTRNRAIDLRRSRTRAKRGGDAVTLALEELQDCVPSGSSPEGELQRRELTRALNRFLGTLPATERSVFLCRYWYFDDLAAICDSFGFRQSKVKSMLHRTRTKLRAYLQKEGLL